MLGGINNEIVNEPVFELKSEFATTAQDVKHIGSESLLSIQIINQPKLLKRSFFLPFHLPDLRMTESKIVQSFSSSLLGLPHKIVWNHQPLKNFFQRLSQATLERFRSFGMHINYCLFHPSPCFSDSSCCCCECVCLFPKLQLSESR